MNLNQIELKRTGLLFFDMLNSYYHEASEVVKQRKKPMVHNAVRLMKAARSADIPIFFAKGSLREDEATSALPLTDTNIPLKPWPGGVVTPVKSAAIEGKSGSEVIPELEPKPTDYYVPKHRWSAFYQTYLDLALRTAKIDTIIISGGSTDVGIAATVFAGRDMDYNMVVVRDACATSHDQRAHDVLMELVFPRMSRVRTTDEVLQMIKESWRPLDARVPYFRVAEWKPTDKMTRDEVRSERNLLLTTKRYDCYSGLRARWRGDRTFDDGRLGRPDGIPA